MTSPNPQPQGNNQSFVTDSLNIELVIVEGNEDTTVRPTRPAILEWRKRKEMERKQFKPDPPGETDPETNESSR